MSPSQGWFESDDDYRKRVAREADESTIEVSTGKAPSQGWFEADESYRDRIAKQANEQRIQNSTGEAPSQGWFESNDDYQTRIRKEANEQHNSRQHWIGTQYVLSVRHLREMTRALCR